jgi:hypothetical protein
MKSRLIVFKTDRPGITLKLHCLTHIYRLTLGSFQTHCQKSPEQTSGLNFKVTNKLIHWFITGAGGGMRFRLEQVDKFHYACGRGSSGRIVDGQIKVLNISATPDIKTNKCKIFLTWRLALIIHKCFSLSTLLATAALALQRWLLAESGQLSLSSPITWV